MAEFCYNNTEQATISCSLFFAMYGYNPKIEVDIVDNGSGEGPPAVKDQAAQILIERNELDKRWQNAVQYQQTAYNKKHLPKQFQMDDLVMLAARNLQQQRPSRKLSDWYLGPFRIINILGTQAYKLKLPENWKIHPVFHVSLLEPYMWKEGENPLNDNPPELINDVEEWSVEAILDEKGAKGKWYYLVKWEGYSDDFNSWEPSEHLKNAPDLVQSFKERKHGSTAAKQRRNK